LPSLSLVKNIRGKRVACLGGVAIVPLTPAGHT
jgi:hypothetical protein